jgi:hypothetical protein
VAGGAFENGLPVTCAKFITESDFVATVEKNRKIKIYL